MAPWCGRRGEVEAGFRLVLRQAQDEARPAVSPVAKGGPRLMVSLSNHEAAPQPPTVSISRHKSRARGTIEET